MFGLLEIVPWTFGLLFIEILFAWASAQRTLFPTFHDGQGVAGRGCVCQKKHIKLIAKRIKKDGTQRTSLDMALTVRERINGKETDKSNEVHGVFETK